MMRFVIAVARAALLARRDRKSMTESPTTPFQTYDAGLLNDFGGGNIDWWHDYIRGELDRAHEFYMAQCDAT